MTTTNALILDIAAWTVLGFGIGYWGHRLPPHRLSTDSSLTRLRSWEQNGRLYVRLGIKRWKDRLPEAGSFFRGGMSKRRLPGHRREDLERFAVETRRAELVHWGLLGSGPVFLLWNPPVLDLAMMGYAIVANLPFIAVQRFNRARVLAILERRA
ncbi:MAG: hypothetical protein N2037_02930 [Acidimicrobiales bacterium]|nr:hypothetical protein [Acidimicrobiales bacterium]